MRERTPVQEKPKPTLPRWRTFTVYMRLNGKDESRTIVAHEIEIIAGTLIFVEHSLLPDGEGILARIVCGFKEFLFFEETMPMDPTTTTSH